MKKLQIIISLIIVAFGLCANDCIYVHFNHGYAPANTVMSVWRKVDWDGFSPFWAKQEEVFDGSIVYNYYFSVNTNDVATAFTFADKTTGKVKAAYYSTVSNLLNHAEFNSFANIYCVFVGSGEINGEASLDLWKDYKSLGPVPEESNGTVIYIR